MLGVSLVLADQDESARIYSPDRTRVVCWNKSRDHSDMYDTDIRYEGHVWDVATGQILTSFHDGYSISHWDGNRMSGSAISSITFREDGAAIIVKYQHGPDREITVPSKAVT